MVPRRGRLEERDGIKKGAALRGVKFRLLLVRVPLRCCCCCCDELFLASAVLSSSLSLRSPLEEETERAKSSEKARPFLLSFSPAAPSQTPGIGTGTR